MEKSYLREALKEIFQNYLIGGLFGLCLFGCLPSFCLNLVWISGVVAFLGNFFAPLIQRYRPRKRISPVGKAVFISGCDSGFGNGIAQVLDDSGYQVFAGCLFPEGDGAVKLKMSASNRLHIVELDVSKDKSVNNAAAYVKEHIKENKLWAVVNNSGIFATGEMHWADIDVLKRVIEVNTIGVVRVTKAFLSLLMESEGRVVTVASASGRYTFPNFVGYCMSKQAAISFSEGLRQEMYKFGVKVVTIEPWLYKTALTNIENTRKNLIETWNRTPEDIKKFYGPGYIEKYIKIAVKMTNWSSKDNLSEVVDCIAEAVRAEQPRYTYFPGTITARFSVWTLLQLPKPLADFFIFYIVKKLSNF